ncbi:hypothetical protein Dred_2308 [Desulforamulus reducens MI-1]|uniref:RsgI N-terminal anti-sigma domain-containing protein n=1 Tax=Desulforamulus reducens (strain ATCC BAA-1160 / DSM 100696 / MI-1) TaxID=349161 RepID=A4J6W5_DESRM|nr:hypothetical protein [Desulforamulus reducens]ABO50818.1 hypothetical protein Dred_2308 [Desulforamulus reducens MI-1]
MAKVKGILVQKKGPLGVLMTSEGRFIRVMLIGKDNSLGQEIPGYELKHPSLTQSIAAASVLIVLLMGIWSQFFINTAAAYVALDINPSIELTVNDSGTVIEVKGLNEDGNELLEKVTPKKMQVYKAVESLVEEAAKCNYLNSNNNVILATVIPTKEKRTVVEQDKLETTVQLAVAQLPTPIKIVIESATEQEHSVASQNGVSVGRYLIHQGSAQRGGNISLDDLKKKGLGQLEKEKGIEIQQYLPHPKMNGKVEIKVKEKSDSDKMLKKETRAPSLKNQPNIILPPGQQKKQDPDRSFANWKEILDHPSQKEAKPVDDERDGEVEEEEIESQKRRDDRRQSYMQNEESTKNEKPAKPSQQQDNGKQRDDKEKDRQKGNDKAKKGKDH